MKRSGQHIIINTALSIVLTAGLFPLPVLCGDDAPEKHGFKIISGRSGGFPIGTLETVGTVRVDGQPVFGRGPLFGGEMIETRWDIAARIFLPSIGEVTIMPSSSVRIAVDKTGSDYQENGCLVAEIVNGEIKVDLQNRIEGYIEAARRTFIASEGASFRFGLRSGELISEVMDGEVVEGTSLNQGSGYEIRRAFFDPQLRKPRCDVQSKTSQRNVVAAQKQPVNTRKSLSFCVRKIDRKVSFRSRRDSMFVPVSYRLTPEEPVVESRQDAPIKVEFALDPPTLGSLDNAWVYADADGLATVNFTAAGDRLEGDIIVKVENETKRFRLQIFKPFFTTPMKILIGAAAVGAGIGIGKAVSGDDKSIKPLPPPVVIP